MTINDLIKMLLESPEGIKDIELLLMDDHTGEKFTVRTDVAQFSAQNEHVLLHLVPENTPGH